MAETDELRRYWDGQAASFDDDPDHGLRDPAVRQAWADLLLPLLPPAPAHVVDLGCGTGSLAVLLAQHGNRVLAAQGQFRRVKGYRELPQLARA
jgi:2-polyprenyl-3-methyl-5-hydroxy-6-metoxy-1,4-benzoquinol methylase